MKVTSHFFKLKNNLFLILFLVLFGCIKSEQDKSTLEKNFSNPPQNSKPKTWMHAMSGNMSKEGLTKDLEAMAEVGIGGLLLFNVTQGIPNGPIIYNSPEHHKMIQHAAIEAERLGLSFGIHNCDGWSSSGGPWVTPEESMKMVVWSETIVNGGKVDVFLQEPTKREGLYKDIAVIAYPTLASELDDIENKVKITSSDSTLDFNIIFDGKVDATSLLNKNEENNPWIQFEYKIPKTIRSVKIIFNDRNSTAILQVAKDGRNYKDVKELFKVRTGKGEWAINDHFKGITAKHFRLKFNNKTALKEVQLTSSYFINNPLGRTAMARTEDKSFAPIGSPENDMIIKKSSILNLTNAMEVTGRLKTNLPEKKWTILRFGYTSTGAFNNPASKEGTGLEVDKLNRKAFKNFFDGFVKKVIDSTKHLAPNALQYVEIDSYEMGGQNWTNDLDSIFKSKKGYNIINFLPLIAGRFIDNSETSEAVLLDYRNVITKLMTHNYYEYFTQLCHNEGLKSYIEPYGFGPLNDLDIGGKTDIPMGEFWMNRPITQTASAVSAAHIYGKPIISAESFTSTPQINWKGNPAMAKTSGDLAWTYGINEFMFHRFVHQANTHVVPGMTMNRWGFHFDRTQTWWKNAGAAWFTYIARGSYLLRQGNPVSDLLVYVGEATPNGAYHRENLNLELSKTINFDNVNTDVLVNRLKIINNKLLLPEGTSYKMLLLKNSKVISLATLKRIYEIANSGVPVYGDIPEKLLGYHTSEAEKTTFNNIAKKVKPLIKPVGNWNTVLFNQNIIPDLQVNNGKAIDYAHRKTTSEDIYFFYNQDTTGSKTFDITFRVANKIPELWNPMTGKIIKKADFITGNSTTRTFIKLKKAEAVFVVFRENSNGIVTVTAPQPNIDFTLSEKNKITANMYKNGNYTIAISSGNTWYVQATDVPSPFKIEGDWDVAFRKENGYGKTLTGSTLFDWKNHPNDSIKYYSGSAIYKKKIMLPKNYISENSLATLNLGKVHIVAEVIINGKNVGIAWMPPYQLEVGKYLIPGENIIEIKVTNQWSNRLIGDERYDANDGNYALGIRATKLKMPQWYVNNKPRPAGNRTTFTTAPFYKKGDSLLPSGLVGPLEIRFSKEIKYILE